MKTRSNSTAVTGTLRSCVPAADGYGSHVEIEVTSNPAPDAGNDFIRAAAGQTLRAFMAPQPDLDAAPALLGREVRATLTYLGGPSGGQAVVQALKAVNASKASKASKAG
jgi:hypothetical protein